MKQAALFSFFLFVFSSNSFGQTTSGTIAIGADFPRFFSGLSKSGMKLNVGAFVADNFLFGVNSGIRYSSIRNLANRRVNGPAVDLGLFARYYIPEGDSNFRIFIHGEGGIDRTWADDLSERHEFVHVGGGVAYFALTNLVFEANALTGVNNEDGELNFVWPNWRIGVKYMLGK